MGMKDYDKDDNDKSQERTTERERERERESGEWRMEDGKSVTKAAMSE